MNISISSSQENNSSCRKSFPRTDRNIVHVTPAPPNIATLKILTTSLNITAAFRYLQSAPEHRAQSVRSLAGSTSTCASENVASFDILRVPCSILLSQRVTLKDDSPLPFAVPPTNFLRVIEFLTRLKMQIKMPCTLWRVSIAVAGVIFATPCLAWSDRQIAWYGGTGLSPPSPPQGPVWLRQLGSKPICGG